MMYDRNAATLLDRAVQAKKLTENALRISGQHVQKARDINRDVQTESFATDKLRQRVDRLDRIIGAHDLPTSTTNPSLAVTRAEIE